MAPESVRPRRVLAAIIAGGRAVRFGGRIKALLQIDGRTILEHQLEVLVPRVSEVVVSANDPAAFASSGLRVIADTEGRGADDDAGRSGGPMLGISAALDATGAQWLLVVGSDMPFLSGALLDLLLSRLDRDGDAEADGPDAVVPWVGGYAEPLLALYAASCAPVFRRHIAGGKRSLNRLLRSDELTVARVLEPELRSVDPELRSLININQPSELETLSRGGR